MNKTVTLNGQTTKVDLVVNMVSRDVHKQDAQGRILHATGIKEFNIGGNVYPVKWEGKMNKSWSLTLEFDGFKCGDSEKKMTEFIISKYGI
jgi:hypothetical protein